MHWRPHHRSMVLCATLVLAALPLVGAMPSASAALPNMVTRQGRQLYLNGAPYRFTGVNAYQLGTYWSVNYGCGGQATDLQLDAFFASLRPNSMVRIWAFQRQAD